MAKLYFYYSAMNAGKSTTLLQSSFNYEERGMQTMLFTASIDDRYETGTISSRLGIQREATLFEKGKNLRKIVEKELKKRNINCVLIDEAQFLSKAHVFELASVVDDFSIPVLCYGLRTDF